MSALILVVLSRASSLLAKLAELVAREQPSATRTPLAARWPARSASLTEIRRELRKLSRQLPYCGVLRPEVTAAGLNGVAANPLYARAWNRGWRALGQGLEGSELSDRLWVSPSWEVYERWCFVRLGQTLATCASSWNWTRDSERWVGERGGRRAELVLQPVFPSRSVPTDGRWSLSRERIPDLALIVDSDGSKRFLLLDAKYPNQPGKRPRRHGIRAHLPRLSAYRVAAPRSLSAARAGGRWGPMVGVDGVSFGTPSRRSPARPGSDSVASSRRRGASVVTREVSHWTPTTIEPPLSPLPILGCCVIRRATDVRV